MSRLSMRKISEAFRQRYELRRSYRDIAKSLNISLSTIYDYLARAKTANISWPLPEGMSEQELYDQLFLPVTGPSVQRSLPEWEKVHQELRKKGMTLRLLWREYRDVHTNGLGYTQFCGRYRDYVKTITPVMRQVHNCILDKKIPSLRIEITSINEKLNFTLLLHCELSYFYFL